MSVRSRSGLPPSRAPGPLMRTRFRPRSRWHSLSSPRISSDQSEFTFLTSLNQRPPGATMRDVLSVSHRPTGPLRQLVASAEGYCVPANPTGLAPWFAVTAPHAGRGTGCPAAGNWPEAAP